MSHMTTLGQIYDTQDVCCLKQRIQIREKEIEKLQKKHCRNAILGPQTSYKEITKLGKEIINVQIYMLGREMKEMIIEG